jgi:hypothetical protein
LYFFKKLAFFSHLPSHSHGSHHFSFHSHQYWQRMEEKNNPNDVHAKKPFLWAQKSSRKLSFSLVSHLCHREWLYIWEEGWEEMTNISQQLTNLFPFPAHHPRPCPILYRQASLVGASRPRAGASPQRISKI